MSEFKVIETQEQLDAIMKDRLERKAKEVEKKYEGFLSPEQVEAKITEASKQIASLSEQLKEKETEITTLNDKAKALEVDALKTKVVNDLGLPFGLASRLSGTTEEEIKADAESLKAFVAPVKVPPLANPESEHVDSTTSALLQMAKSLG